MQNDWQYILYLLPFAYFQFSHVKDICLAGLLPFSPYVSNDNLVILSYLWNSLENPPNEQHGHGSDIFPLIPL